VSWFRRKPKKHVFRLFLSGGHTVLVVAESFSTKRNTYDDAYIEWSIRGMKRPRQLSFNLKELVGWEQVS